MELLVVILIITVLLTIGAAGFRNAGGKGVSTALPSTEAIFDEARSVAVGKGTRSIQHSNIYDSWTINTSRVRVRL